MPFGWIRVYTPLVAADGLLYASDGLLYSAEAGGLITDRAQTDVNRAEILSAKGAGMTVNETAEWLAGMKGAYNASDLNRVGMAVEYLAERLRQSGYAPLVSARTDWTMKDIPSPAQMAQYLENITALREALAMPASTPDVPEDMEYLDWREANNIERILEMIDETLTRMERVWFYSGDLYIGEV